jgi:hypothetical protein
VPLDYRDIRGLLTDLDTVFFHDIRQADREKDAAEELAALDHAIELLDSLRDQVQDQRDELTTPEPAPSQVRIAPSYDQ